MSQSIVIRGATVVNPDATAVADVLIVDGVIAGVLEDLSRRTLNLMAQAVICPLDLLICTPTCVSQAKKKQKLLSREVVRLHWAAIPQLLRCQILTLLRTM